jgi:hypothetical protein
MFLKNLLFIVLVLTLTSAFSVPIKSKNKSEYLISTDFNTSLQDLKELLKNYEIKSINIVAKHMKSKIYKVVFNNKVFEKDLKKLKGILKVEKNNLVGVN